MWNDTDLKYHQDFTIDRCELIDGNLHWHTIWNNVRNLNNIQNPLSRMITDAYGDSNKIEFEIKNAPFDVDYQWPDHKMAINITSGKNQRIEN